MRQGVESGESRRKRRSRESPVERSKAGPKLRGGSGGGAGAAKFGKRVHAHAHDPGKVSLTSLEPALSPLHSGEFVDEEGLEVMKETGCIFIPPSPGLTTLRQRSMSGNTTRPISVVRSKSVGRSGPPAGLRGMPGGHCQGLPGRHTYGHRLRLRSHLPAL